VPPDDATVRITCPNCKARLKMPEAYLGRAVSCPLCRAPVLRGAPPAAGPPGPDPQPPAPPVLRPKSPPPAGPAQWLARVLRRPVPDWANLWLAGCLVLFVGLPCGLTCAGCVLRELSSYRRDDAPRPSPPDAIDARAVPSRGAAAPPLAAVPLPAVRPGVPPGPAPDRPPGTWELQARTHLASDVPTVFEEYGVAGTGVFAATRAVARYPAALPPLEGDVAVRDFAAAALASWRKDGLGTKPGLTLLKSEDQGFLVEITSSGRAVRACVFAGMHTPRHLVLVSIYYYPEATSDDEFASAARRAVVGLDEAVAGPTYP